jgi:hypothetical protein
MYSLELHGLVGRLYNRHPPPEVLVRAPVPPLPGGDPIALHALGPLLVEVGPSAVLLLGVARGAIEVVEHQVHVGSLLRLQMVDDGLIPVHFDLDVSLGLPGEGPRLVEVGARLLLMRERGLVKVLLLLLPLSLLLGLLVITNVECLPSRREGLHGLLLVRHLLLRQSLQGELSIPTTLGQELALV